MSLFSRPKSEAQLQSQIETAEGMLGAPLRPPHADIELLKTSLQTLRERYPKRYAFYVETLRREARERKGVDAKLGEEEARRTKAWLLALNSLDAYIHKHHAGPEKQTLRDKQIPVFEAIRDYFEHGGSQGYVKLPTGTGKTVIFTELIEAMDLRTLVVVPREILLKQTQQRMAEFAPTLDTGLVYADAKQHGRQVTIITYDSFVSGVNSSQIDPKAYDLLVLDEAHRSLSEMRRKTLGAFSHTLQIGFTATPEFSDKKKVEHILPDLITEMSIRDAVENGMLCSFISGVIETEVDLSDVKLTKEGEYDEALLKKAVDIEIRNRAAVDIYEQLAPGKKAIVYCVGIDHAKHVAEAFAKKGHVAAAVWGDMPAREKNELLSCYQKGEIKILCNADLLIEGFDDAETILCINLRPTRSLVNAEQRGGRVLRLDARNPDKMAYVMDFLDHKGESGLDGAVLFSEVAGQVYGMSGGETARGARVFNDAEKEVEDPNEAGASDRETPDETDPRIREVYERLENIDLEGMKTRFGVEEVLAIIREKGRVGRERHAFLGYDEFVKEVKAAGVENIKEYKTLRKDHPEWPSAPDVYYKDTWGGWTAITGNIAPQKMSFLPYEEFLKEVKEAGVKSEKEYQAMRRGRLKWPSSPDRLYKDTWQGWTVITGNVGKKEVPFLFYEEFLKEVKEAGVKSAERYRLMQKDHPEWPSSPSAYYKDTWQGWGVITGNITTKEMSFLPYDEFVKEVKAAEVKSSKHYKGAQKDHPKWPSLPNQVYKDAWEGWTAITGNADKKEMSFLPYEEFVKEVKAAGVKSNGEYKALQRDRPEWPSNPDRCYRDAWPGWSALTGNPSRKKGERG